MQGDVLIPRMNSTTSSSSLPHATTISSNTSQTGSKRKRTVTEDVELYGMGHEVDGKEAEDADRFEVKKPKYHQPPVVWISDSSITTPTPLTIVHPLHPQPSRQPDASFVNNKRTGPPISDLHDELRPSKRRLQPPDDEADEEAKGNDLSQHNHQRRSLTPHTVDENERAISGWNRRLGHLHQERLERQRQQLHQQLRDSQEADSNESSLNQPTAPTMVGSSTSHINQLSHGLNSFTFHGPPATPVHSRPQLSQSYHHPEKSISSSSSSSMMHDSPTITRHQGAPGGITRQSTPFSSPSPSYGVTNQSRLSMSPLARFYPSPKLTAASAPPSPSISSQFAHIPWWLQEEQDKINARQHDPPPSSLPFKQRPSSSSSSTTSHSPIRSSISASTANATAASTTSHPSDIFSRSDSWAGDSSSMSSPHHQPQLDSRPFETVPWIAHPFHQPKHVPPPPPPHQRLTQSQQQLQHAHQHSSTFVPPARNSTAASSSSQSHPTPLPPKRVPSDSSMQID